MVYLCYKKRPLVATCLPRSPPVCHHQVAKMDYEYWLLLSYHSACTLQWLMLVFFVIMLMCLFSMIFLIIVDLKCYRPPWYQTISIKYGCFRFRNCLLTGAPFTNTDQLQTQHREVITSIIMCGIISLILSQTSTVQPLKFGNVLANSSHDLLGMWLLIHAEIKVNRCCGVEFMLTGVTDFLCD